MYYSFLFICYSFIVITVVDTVIKCSYRPIDIPVYLLKDSYTDTYIVTDWLKAGTYSTSLPILLLLHRLPDGFNFALLFVWRCRVPGAADWMGRWWKNALLGASDGMNLSDESIAFFQFLRVSTDFPSDAVVLSMRRCICPITGPGAPFIGVSAIAVREWRHEMIYDVVAVWRRLWRRFSKG